MTNKRSKATRRTESEAASARAAAIRREHERGERRRRTIAVSAAVIVVLALIFGIGFAVQSNRDTTGTAATVPSGAVNKYGLPIGQKSAPVTVAIYEDFMCPICNEFEQASRSWMQQYVDQGKMRVAYHVISILDRSSNGTEYSTRSASAAAVVYDTAGPQVFKKFHDLLYENQPSEGSNGLSDQQLIDFAVQAGASRAKVSQPIKDVQFRQWTSNATDYASKQPGFQGTPSVYIDGKQLTGYQTVDQLAAVLKQTVDSKQG